VRLLLVISYVKWLIMIEVNYGTLKASGIFRKNINKDKALQK